MAVRLMLAGLGRLVQQASHARSGPPLTKWLPHSCIVSPNSSRAQPFPALPNNVVYPNAAAGGLTARTYNSGGGAAAWEDESRGRATGIGLRAVGARTNRTRNNDRRTKQEASRDRSALNQQLREWPEDVDLVRKLPDGRFGGRIITSHDLRAIFYSFAKDPKSLLAEDAGLETTAETDAESGTAEATRGNADATGGNALGEHAQRALNVFNWWEAKGQTGAHVRGVLHPLLKMLAAAGCRDEIRSLWRRYRAGRIGHQDVAVLQFMAAARQVQLYDDVIDMFETSQEQEWLVRSTGLDTVVRAMQGKGCSANEVWEFYKGWVEKMGSKICQRPGFVALLELGVPIDQIRALDDGNVSYVHNRLIQALSTMGRKDEARALVKEYIESHGQTKIGVSALVSYLRTLIQSGFLAEAQQMADAQEKLKVTMKGALVYCLKQASNRWTGLETYEDLMLLEGSHRTNLTVQALLITNCYAVLGKTSPMYEAYLRGKQFEGHFHAPVYTTLIEHLTQDGRATEVEAVLQDYYAARRAGTVLALRDTAFQSVAQMYLKANHPGKVVELVQEMVKQNVFVPQWVTDHWSSQLAAGDHLAEAEVVRDAQKEMRVIARAWLDRKIKIDEERAARQASGNDDDSVSGGAEGTEPDGETEALAEEPGVEGETTTSGVKETEDGLRRG